MATTLISDLGAKYIQVGLETIGNGIYNVGEGFKAQAEVQREKRELGIAVVQELTEAVKTVVTELQDLH